LLGIEVKGSDMSQEAAPEPRAERRRGSPEAMGIEIRTVPAGTRLRLADDSVVEVSTNPEDGYWLLCQYLESPSDPGRVGSQEMILWSDIAGTA
jgi:hypothetical protein